MSKELGTEALGVFQQVPVNRAASADEVDQSKPAALRHFRNLLAHGLVEAESRRPLRVRVADDQFARAFHGTLKEKPYARPVLAGSHLAVLAALHAKPGLNAVELAQETGLHPNTVRGYLGNLQERALLVKHGRGYAISDYARDIEDLARFYIHHQFQRKTPQADIVMRRGSDDLVLVVESKQRLDHLPTTAACRFQEEGADVMPARFQYRIHALKDEQEVGLSQAFEDAKALGTSPRTLTAMHQFLESHG